MRLFWLFLIHLCFIKEYALDQSKETINVLYVNEELNQVGNSALNSALLYASETLGLNINLKHVVVKFIDAKTMVSSLCTTYKKLIDENTSPHVVLDFTKSRQASETVKSFTEGLGLPTIAASFGQVGDLILWRNISDLQKNYLLQIMPPADIIPEIVPIIISRQAPKGDVNEPTKHFDARIRNAAILFDDSFVMDHKHKSLMVNIATRHIINQIEEPIKIKDQLKQIVYNLDIINFFVLGSLDSIKNILNIASEMNLLGTTFVWYVITQDQNDLILNYKNATIIYIKPISDLKRQDNLRNIKIASKLNAQPNIAAEFYFDLALRTFLTIKNMFTKDLWPENLTYISCDDYNGHNTPFRQSLNLREAFKNISNQFSTYGPINITSNGYSQMEFTMQINRLDIQENSSQEIETLGLWNARIGNNLALRDESILNIYTAKKIYRIVTVLQKPFVMFDENTKKYYGMCVEILEQITKMISLEYTIYTAPDGKFGNMDEEGNWNGMIRELIEQRADIGMGSISVMAERENVVDFTVPFHELVGITILMKKTRAATSLFQFLAVLDIEVWLCILGAFLFTSFLIWVFDRWSPYSYQNNRESFTSDTEIREFDLKESFWFCMTSLTPQGGGEVPKNLSGILVAASWWIFGFIIIASYTANLSAFLTVARMELPIESLDDLTNQNKIQYAPLNGSYVMEYFKRRANIESKFFEIWKEMSLNDSLSPIERAKLSVWEYPISDKYIKMWQAMQKAGLPSTLEEAISRVLSSKSSSDGFAYIGDGTDIRYLEATNCDLQLVGEEFSRKPYAFAIRKRSRLKDQFNTGLLFYQNNKAVQKIIDKWWKHNPEIKNCVKEDFRSSDGVSMSNFGGVFIVIFIGVGLACIGLAFEYWWYKHRKESPQILIITHDTIEVSNSPEINNDVDPDINVIFRQRCGSSRGDRDCVSAENTKTERLHKSWIRRSIHSSKF